MNFDDFTGKAENEKRSIGFVGFGLMGASLAFALRKAGIQNIYAYDISYDTSCAALENAGALQTEEGSTLIDECFTDVHKMLPLCDVVFLCIYPCAAIDFLHQYVQYFKSGCLISDICGVKKKIAETMTEIMQMRSDIDCIPGHPMAGSEKEGFAHAGECHFEGRNYILTPLPRNKSGNLALLKQFISVMGFSCIVETTSEIHDEKIAFTSQLCHVIACALVDCEQDTAITSFGGGSFEDLTRIAMINAPMWTELFIENKNALITQISKFENSLAQLKNLVYTEQSDELKKNLTEVRKKRIEMGSSHDK